MGDDEEVVGILKRCPTCEEKTVHVDGVCQSHRVVRRRKSEVPTTTGMSDATKFRIKVGVAAVVSVGLVLLFGAVHVCHGDRSGMHLCWKDGWTLEDTFVNLDDVYDNKPTTWKVLGALGKCHLL